jgi:hypothetical protein
MKIFNVALLLLLAVCFAKANVLHGDENCELLIIVVFIGIVFEWFPLTVFGFAAGVDSKVQKFVHLQMFKKVKMFTLADCHACAKPML